jgi:hypothetical protein
LKRSITEVIRRGFENVVANWPLILIRLASSIFFIILVVVAVIAAVIPLAMSIGLNKLDPASASDPLEFMLDVLARTWPILLYILGIITILLTVIIAIYSFVEAGCARVYVDGELAAAAYPLPVRQHLKSFTAERWLSGGRNHWWPVFWIYNIAWGVAMLVLLLPALAVLALIFILRESPGGMAVAGCMGLVVIFLVFFLVAIVTNAWCLKAIIVSVARNLGAMESLRVAWREFRTDAGRHIAVVLILFVLMFVGAMVFSSVSAFSNIDDSATFQLMTLPLQLTSSLLNSIFSAFMTGWFLASFAALTTEPRQRLSPLARPQ